MKGSKLQITVTVLLSKPKINVDIEYAPLNCNLKGKTYILQLKERLILINMTLKNIFKRFYIE